MSMTSRLSLALLPVELYDPILSFITSTKDLLNFALTCRQLCELIIPNHIDYRDVVCSSFDRSVWEHFLNNPHLAKRIHSIKILDNVGFQDEQDEDSTTETEAESERHRVIPRELQVRSMREDTELEGGLQMKAFTKSILVMKDLYSFEYKGPCPAFPLFAYFAHYATGLRIFKYEYDWTGGDCASQLRDIIDSASLISKGFEYLECCSLNIRFQDKYDNRDNVLSMINNLLENNHSLKSVTLFLWDTGLEPIPLPRFLLDANWPKIHTFSMGGDFTIFEEDIDLQLRISQTQSFFSKHVSLEKIRFSSWHSGSMPICPGSIQPDSDMLPELHTLDLDLQMPYLVSELIPENVVSRLANLSVNLSGVPDSFITSGHLKNIRRLYTEIDSSDRIPLLLEAIPNIERLHITTCDPNFPGYPVIEDPGVLQFLPGFTKHSRNLTHLSLLLPFCAEAFAPEEYARELDKLEFIYFLRSRSSFNPWLRVIRSPSGAISLEPHLEESDEWDRDLWMGFDSSFN